MKISKNAIRRIMEDAGAKRISLEALEELDEILVDVATKITKDANDLSRHAKRVTIKAEDIKLSAKNMGL